MKIYKILLGLSFIAVFTASCKHDVPYPTNPSVSEVCSDDTVYFQKDILPIVLSNCAMSGCHNRADKAEDIVLVDYESIMKDGEVKPYNPNGSKLYTCLIKNDADERMPLGLPPLNSSLIAKIKKWIEQGAKFNDCASCDTAGTVSYTNHILPILQNNCNGCHTASSGNVDLTTYDKVKVVVDNGSLRGTVNHLNGFSPMPLNAPKLNDCNLSLIDKWINNGAPNN